MTINLELLEEFLHKRLRYKEHIKPIAYKIYNNGLFIWIGLDNFGEVIKAEIYSEWLKKKRNEKIEKIIN
jgi:hypothetical protein